MGFADFGRGLGKNNFRLKENLKLKRKASKFPRPHGHPEQLDPEVQQNHDNIEEELRSKIFFRTFIVILVALILMLIIVFKLNK